MKLIILCAVLLISSLSCAVSPARDNSITVQEYQGKVVAVNNNAGRYEVTYIYLDGQKVIPVVTNVDLEVGKTYKLVVVYDRNQHREPYGELLKIEEIK